MEYFSQKLCRGYFHEQKQCEYMDNCKLCQFLTTDDNSNEIYGCGFGVPDYMCKRDNPNFKPMKKDEFLKIYKEIPISMRRGMGLSECLEYAKIMGLVEKN